MNAILLAAGVGKRLNNHYKDLPKVLIPIDGKSLLERHFEIFSQLAFAQVTLVVGFQKEKIINQLGEQYEGVKIKYIENPRYREGSIYSLYLARQACQESFTVIMDADVLYPARLMKRLIESKWPNSFLMDAKQEESGEEMMLGARKGRVLKIARTLGEGFDQFGEGVGFLKLSPEGGKILAEHLIDFVDKGITDVEYEDAFNPFLQECEVGFELVGDIPWTEIDFPEDVDRAVHEILPKMSE
ncbi:MAG: hypothetical protein IEMM0008_1313 [bacterium]|nr:MAG: hypothetical protein IEMM0008_1313 [bacterium]